MTTDEAKAKVLKEPDFIAIKRVDYSLEQLMEKYPEGCPDHIIAKALMIPEHEVEEMYSKATQKLKMIMGVRDEE